MNNVDEASTLAKEHVVRSVTPRSRIWLDARGVIDAR